MKVLDAAKYLVDTSELEWSESVQNTNKSSADV